VAPVEATEHEMIHSEWTCLAGCGAIQAIGEGGNNPLLVLSTDQDKTRTKNAMRIRKIEC